MREKYFPAWEELGIFLLGFEAWGGVQGDGKGWKEGKHGRQREEPEQRPRVVKVLVWTWWHQGRSSSGCFKLALICVYFIDPRAAQLFPA